MSKHNANLDIRGDLRVRGRVEENLRVRQEVEASAFYIRGVGEVGAGGVSDHGGLSGLGDDDHTQYIRVDGTRAFTGAQSMGGNRLTSLGVPTAGFDAARLQDIGPGFYGIAVGQSNNLAIFRGINTIKFEAANFYVTQNPSNTDEVQVNLRGAASGGSGGASDHGDLSGLLDDDHTQYIRVDGARAFTGNQSIGGNRITSLGAPVAATDAARLQDIGPGFYGITVKDGTHTFNDDTLSFNFGDFYLTKDSNANPVVNLTKSDPRPSTSRALLSKTIATSIINNDPAVTLSWEVEQEDLGGWFTSASPTLLTVPSGVKRVRITAKVALSSTSAPVVTSYITLSALKNGVALVPNETNRTTVVPISSIVSTIIMSTRILAVSPGDSFTLTLAANNYAANPTISTGPTYFAIEAIE